MGEALTRRDINAVAIGLIWGALIYIGSPASDPTASDFDQLWLAARAVMARGDPYAAVAASRWPWPLLYPMPAVVVALPFALLPLPIARAVWVAFCTGLLAWAWGREPWRFMDFLSSPIPPVLQPPGLPSSAKTRGPSAPIRPALKPVTGIAGLQGPALRGASPSHHVRWRGSGGNGVLVPKWE